MHATTIDEVITRLDTIADAAGAAGTRDGYFAALYAQVTRGVRLRARQGWFADGPFMEQLDVVFANRYFDAYDAWKAGGRPSRSWAVAFSGLARPDLCILQHLLLGMNAHINLDLGPAVVDTTPGGAIAARQADFDKLNGILLTMLPRVQAALDAVSPLLLVVDRLGLQCDEAIAGFSMKVARVEAWHAAEDIARSPDRSVAVDRLDRRVAVLARGLADPLPPFGAAFQVVRGFEDHSDVARILRLIRAVGLDG